MPYLVFKLNGVPSDEADDVRTLLTDNDIHYYETSSGRWGVSIAAIWVREDGEYEQARQLISQYQIERAGRVRKEYSHNRTNLWMRFLENPVEFIMILLAVCFILGITLYPFLGW